MNDPSTRLRKTNQVDKYPLTLINDWLKLAEASEPNDPTAMALASVDEEGMPNVRMVLMRGIDESGVVFYTNFESQKGIELLQSKKAAVCFHWKSLRKSLRVRGVVEVVSEKEADAYFYSRPRGSRLGAHASKQSRPLESRFALEKAVAVHTAKFGTGDIPRPDYWSGFRIRPLSIEFWSDGKFRLHDRTRYDRVGLDADWQVTNLYP